MGIKAKIKGICRRLGAAAGDYEELLREQQRLGQAVEELKKKEAQQEKTLGELKELLDGELHRRDDWKKREAEAKRQAEGRPIWVIKCPAPEDASRVRWGDYHYGVSLKRHLEKLGMYVILDTREDWDCPYGEDVVLVLRGCKFYRPDRRNEKCLYIMWNISHPDQVEKEEYELYDLVCVGSRYYAKELAKRVSVPVVPLQQCTDTDLFFPDQTDTSRGDYIFIGNSRGIARSCVMWSVEDKLPLKIWGSGWGKILQGHMDLIEAPTIENDEIPVLYRRAKVTLNDHWQDMLDYQFVNNRIFDALACGLPVISDGCEELREIFPEAVLYYSSREEFEQCLEKLEGDYESIKACVRSQWEMIHEKYSFQARARELVELAKKYREQEITPVPILPIH